MHFILFFIFYCWQFLEIVVYVICFAIFPSEVKSELESGHVEFKRGGLGTSACEHL